MKRLLLFFAMTALAFGADLTGNWVFKLQGVPVSGSNFPNPLVFNFSKTANGVYIVTYNRPAFELYETSVIGNRVSFSLRPAQQTTSNSMFFNGKINTAATQITGAVGFAGKRGKFVAVRQ